MKRQLVTGRLIWICTVCIGACFGLPGLKRLVYYSSPNAHSVSLVKLVFHYRVPTVYHWIYLCPVVAASHAMIIIFHDFWPLFVANLLYGISFGITVAQAPAIMFDIAGHARYPQAIALMNFTYGLGDLFGGVIGGMLTSSP